MRLVTEELRWKKKNPRSRRISQRHREEKEEVLNGRFSGDPEAILGRFSVVGPMPRTMFKGRRRDDAQRKERIKKHLELMRRDAGLALKHFNESSSIEKGTEYELVMYECNGVFQKDDAWFYHINFLAKPKGAADKEVKLFFAEIKKPYLHPVVVNSCSILGAEGVVTGRGCKACGARSYVQHPVDGNFTKGQPHQYYTIAL